MLYTLPVIDVIANRTCPLKSKFITPLKWRHTNNALEYPGVMSAVQYELIRSTIGKVAFSHSSPYCANFCQRDFPQSAIALISMQQLPLRTSILSRMFRKLGKYNFKST